MLYRRAAGFIPLLALLALAGCQPAASTPTSAAPADAPARTKPAAAAREYWDVLMMQGSKVGHAHTSVVPIRQEGRELLKITCQITVQITRFGDQSEQKLSQTSFETLDGRIVRFESQMALGQTPVVTHGEIIGHRAKLTTGKSPPREIAWPEGTLGYFGVEQSLERQPLKPGERRRVMSMQPFINQIVPIDLEAADFEETRLLDGKDRLLRVKTVVHLLEPKGQKIETTYWTDARGQTLKSRENTMAMETYRATRAAAESKNAGTAFDFGRDAVVPLARKLADPHGTREAHYVLHLDSGNPAETFASGATQTLKARDAHTAELTVRAVRPCEKRGSEPKPAAEAIRSNRIIDSDNPAVVAMAREARGKLKDPCQIAKVLERYVHEAITAKNFTHAFMTAGEVAGSRAGDCTEHAVLLAALARASGIPARVAVGLVYVNDLGGFGYHMWTEMYLSGSWVPMDATLGQGGIGGAHLKISDSTLAGDSPYASFLAVAGVLGRLKIELVDIR